MLNREEEEHYVATEANAACGLGGGEREKRAAETTGSLNHSKTLPACALRPFANPFMHDRVFRQKPNLAREAVTVNNLRGGPGRAEPVHLDQHT